MLAEFATHSAIKLKAKKYFIFTPERGRRSCKFTSAPLGKRHEFDAYQMFTR